MNKHKRQSFLGTDSQDRIENIWVGIAGLGGGGSHIVQQLAHIGFRNFVIFDDDVIEDTNLNRLVGAGVVDVKSEMPKVMIAKRMIYNLVPDANVVSHQKRWQEEASALRRCNIVFGCLESYAGRLELEVFCRQNLIHLIDIGMDVHGENPSQISGQVIQSSPGGACMTCMGFITRERLTVEALLYGIVGGRPQVVWPNGVLASTAVGLAMDLVCDWTKFRRPAEYLIYDGNTGFVQRSITLRNLDLFECCHYPLDELGPPTEIKL